MRKSQFINEQNIGIDRESRMHVVAATAKKHKVSSRTIYRGQGAAHLTWTNCLLGPTNEQLAVWNGFTGAACRTTTGLVAGPCVDTNPTGRPEAFVGVAVGVSACSFKDAFGGSEPEALGSPFIEDEERVL